VHAPTNALILSWFNSFNCKRNSAVHTTMRETYIGSTSVAANHHHQQEQYDTGILVFLQKPTEASLV